MSDYTEKRKRERLAQLSTVQSAVVTIKTVFNQLDRIESGRIGGPDTDFWAGPWQPEVAKLNGAAFAFIRAGNAGKGSSDGTDPQFRPSWEKSRGLFPRSPYWYLTKDPAYSIGGQARKLAGLFPNGYDGELPIVLDLEEDVSWKIPATKKREHLGIADAYSFLSVLEKAWPGWDKRWIDYTNWSWPGTFGHPDYKVPLWLSNPPPWGRPELKFDPILPEPWRSAQKLGLKSDGVLFAGAAFLQTSFAADGRFYGVLEKGIDLNYWMGTLAELYAFCGKAMP